MSLKHYLESSIQVLQSTTADNTLLGAVDEATQLIIEALTSGLPVLVCGNGGSACDALHITGELVGRFLMERKALNVIALSDNVGILTALANDYSYDYVFARQVEAYAKPGAVLIGLTTSGNSANVVRAFETARELGMKTVAFTKKGSTKIASLSDVLIGVPSSSTPLIQQVHICLYHYLCHAIEQDMFGQEQGDDQKVVSAP
ncbi:MAG: SIS domain-containing protein [Alphaproteobacteria bacterium]|jgi:D-sedoheptulose 7-phosphate isomerase|nr:SIS domain-containing protein [Alphaproteobacteria bacterium]